MAIPEPNPAVVMTPATTRTRPALSVTIDADVLLAYRIRRGITQYELNLVSGISIRTIQRIERGHGHVLFPTARALANALKIDARELLVELGDQPDTNSLRRPCPHADPACIRCLVQRIRQQRKKSTEST